MDERLHDQIRDVGEAHWWYEGRRRIIEAQLDALMIPDPARHILEIGCGSGSMLTSLARFGRVDGLEPNAAAVAYCQAAFGEIADVAKGAVPDDIPRSGAYDLVAAFDVLEHLDDDVAALEAVAASLRPGGRFVATVPAFPSLWGKQDELSHHHRRYRAQGLSAAASEAGLRVDRLTYFNTLMFPPIALVRLARRLAERRARGRRSSTGSDFDAGPNGAASTVLLAKLFASERHLLSYFDLPFGVSLLLVTTRQA